MTARPGPPGRAGHERPLQFLQWAHETFGDIALAPDERALRFIEEAVEVASTMNIDAATLHAIVDRVAARPNGAIRRELGQCLATLEMLALVVAIDADQEATAELDRVKAIPKEEWARRHGAKVALGIAR